MKKSVLITPRPNPPTKKNRPRAVRLCSRNFAWSSLQPIPWAFWRYEREKERERRERGERQLRDQAKAGNVSFPERRGQKQIREREGGGGRESRKGEHGEPAFHQPFTYEYVSDLNGEEGGRVDTWPLDIVLSQS